MTLAVEHQLDKLTTPVQPRLKAARLKRGKGGRFKSGKVSRR